jgi:hypothetical protein
MRSSLLRFRCPSCPCPRVEEEEKKKKHAPADPPPFPGVRHVAVWALLSAGCVVFSIAYALIVVRTRVDMHAYIQTDPCIHHTRLTYGACSCSRSACSRARAPATRR